MKRVTFVTLGTILLLFVAQAAWADEGKVRCGIAHSIRNAGAELRSASTNFNNGDLVNSVTIERLTIYDFFGAVVHDSGPAIGVLHPLNTDTTPPTDITVVPPGANYYIRTNHIWGNNPIGLSASGNDQGQSMAIVVEFSKSGKRDLFNVNARPRTRQRILSPTPGVGFVEGAETSSDRVTCFDVK